MSNKSVGVVIGLIIGLVIGLPAGYFLQQTLSSSYNQPQTNTQNPIFVNSDESVQAGWFKSNMSTPVVSSMNETEVPSLEIIVHIDNNNSLSLFNIGIDVTYKTIEDKWTTITKTNLGFVDALSEKPVKLKITDPYVYLWETKKAVYSDPDTHWTNGTVCVFNLDDISTIAYGYAEP